MNNRPHIFSLTPDELTEHVRSLDMPTFRARQILEWVYRKAVTDPLQMTNLSAADRDKLSHHLSFITGQIIGHQNATDHTQKLLIQWPAVTRKSAGPHQPLPLLDDPATRQTECVMIPSVSRDSGKHRRTACVSSQVGCPVGCKFCASGLGGLDGNLSAGQIVEQVYQLSHHLGSNPITNVVFMGMGEPLANFDAVTRAVDILTAPWGMNLAGRRITISTVGLPAQIRRLATLHLPVTLAISLHAPNDELRKQIIPWAQFVSIEQLIDAGREYFTTTGREVTLEYILLGNVNDQPEHAHQLASVAGKLRSNINLIRYNQVASLPYQRPEDDAVHRFQTILKNAGRNVHIRASRGRDIAAACGQLRHEHQTKP